MGIFHSREPETELVSKRLYVLVFSDSRLTPFFRGVKRATLERKQADFILHVISQDATPEEVAHLVDLHAFPMRQGMTIEHFDIVVAHLKTALRRVRLTRKERSTLFRNVAGLRKGFQDRLTLQ